MNKKKVLEILKKHDLYATGTRVRLLDFLSRQSRPLTARAIHSAMSAPCPDLATVHRTLNSLASHGIVSAFSVGSSRQYLFNGPERHEHVAVCLSCGNSQPIDAESEGTLTAEAESAGKLHGFRVLCHSVVHYGFCASCISTNQHACKEEE